MKLTPRDNYLQYCAGWRDGAAIRAMDPKRCQHTDKGYADLYNRGYTDGQKARREASQIAALEFGYTETTIWAR